MHCVPTYVQSLAKQKDKSQASTTTKNSCWKNVINLYLHTLLDSPTPPPTNVASEACGGINKNMCIQPAKNFTQALNCEYFQVKVTSQAL